MHFDLTDEQKMLGQTAESFAKKDSPVERFRKMREHETGWEKSMWEKIGGELGLTAIPFPEDLGGIGGGLVELYTVAVALGSSLVPEPFLQSIAVCGMAISQSGTDAQKESVLAPVIEGKASLALAYAEDASRYDPALVAMEAKASGSDYVLSGEKAWVENGHAADTVIVAARTAGKAGDESGITLFLVPGDAAGLSRKAVSTMDGFKRGHLTFKDVKVPASAILGEKDKGFAILERALDRGAAMAVAEGLGMAREAMTRTIEYMKVRVQFGVPIGSFQALQHRAADMFIEAQLLHSMAILAAIEGDSEDRDTRRKAVSQAKVQLAKSGWFITSQAIQLHGGIGCTDEQDVGLFFKRMHALNHSYGDQDYHLDRIAGLPDFEETAA